MNLISQRRSRHKRGFTLLEVIVSIAIMAVIGGLTWMTMQSSLKLREVLIHQDTVSRSARVSMDQLKREIKVAFLTKNTVISDTRFPNEVKAIRAHGGKIIRVKRGQDPDWFTNYVEGNIEPTNVHSSEYAWAKEEFDYVIENNGTKNELSAKVDKLLVSNKIPYSPSQSSDAA